MAQDIFKFELNTYVKDNVSGFPGIILGRTEHSTGCIQYGVSPEDLDKDGKLKEWEWFDEIRLEFVKAPKVEKLESNSPKPRGKFELNTYVEDKVSGFPGIILSRTEYSTGHIRYGVSPTVLDKDGKLKEWEWFDETRLESVKATKVENLESHESKPGGPAPKAPEVN